MQYLGHHISANWHERTMPVADGRGGHLDAVPMIRVHRSSFKPENVANEARLKSLIAKVNVAPFMDADAEHLLCVNSDWRQDTGLSRSGIRPPSGSGFHSESDPAPGEWAAILFERAQLGWNETYEPADGGKVRKTTRDNYTAANFGKVLGLAVIGG